MKVLLYATVGKKKIECRQSLISQLVQVLALKKVQVVLPEHLFRLKTLARRQSRRKQQQSDVISNGS